MATSASARSFALRCAVLAGAGVLVCELAVAQLHLPVEATETAQLLHRVNEDINRSTVQVDEAVDHWATPDELQRSRRGDCEDLAIAKYFALLRAGVPTQHLLVAYALVQLGGGELWRPHMVLAYLGEQGAQLWPVQTEPLILDSLITEIRPVSRRPDLRVLFGFGLEGLRTGLEGPRLADQQLEAWQALLARRAAQ